MMPSPVREWWAPGGVCVLAVLSGTAVNMGYAHLLSSESIDEPRGNSMFGFSRNPVPFLMMGVLSIPTMADKGSLFFTSSLEAFILLIILISAGARPCFVTVF